MPRQPRPHLTGAYWHVIARGNRRQNIFEEPADWERFHDALVEELSTESAIIIALCLLTNHFHLVSPSDIDRLSRALHRLLTSHAAYMNKKYGRTGHLFEDRFKSYPCDPEFGLKPLVRYVHYNPVRAGLVQSPEEWRWSTHREYLDTAQPSPTGRTLLFDRFGSNPAEALRNYRAYMAPIVRPNAARKGERVPLGVIAAYVERDRGHRPGILKERSQRRDLLGTRKRFVDLALAEGHSVGDIAAFLCITGAAVYHSVRP